MKKLKIFTVMAISLIVMAFGGQEALAAVTVYDREGFTYDVITLVAKIVDNMGEPLLNGPYQASFEVGGNAIGSATIDETGQSQIDWVVDFVPVESTETYPITVSFAGSEYYDPMEGEGTFTLNSAQWAMEDAIAELDAIRPLLDGDAVEKVDEALYYLMESLYGEPGDEEILWLDASHLDPDNGDDVFDTASDAVEKLMELLEKPDEFGLSPEVVAELEVVIQDKIDKAEILMKIALDEAIAAGADAEAIGDITEKMEDAYQAIAEGKWDQALEDFGDAWGEAVDATGDLQEEGQAESDAEAAQQQAESDAEAAQQQAESDAEED